jgi:glycosyltransferase involved in cell wall biosynthesis
MKVFQVLNQFLPHQTAGTEVYTWALSKQLQKKGIHVKILIPNYGKNEFGEYIYDDLPVYQFQEPSVVDRSLMMGFREADGLEVFEEFLIKEKPSVVHFHEMTGSNGIGLKHIIAAKNTGAKVFFTFHLAGYSCRTGNLFYKDKEICDGFIKIKKCSDCYLYSKGYKNLSPLLLPASMLLFKMGINTTRWKNKAGTALGTATVINNLKENFEKLIQACDKVVVLTNWYQKILLLNGVPEKKIAQITQAKPLDFTNEGGKKIERDSTVCRLIFLGRIDPLKGLHHLLEAIMTLPKDKIHLDIFGQTGDETYENEWRKKTMSNSNIHWKGKLLQENVVHTIQQYDALCLCSTFSEMSPIVIQEAFAARIPVIASNVYGNAEQIRHGKNGLLFNFNDVIDLRRQIEKCITEPELLKNMSQNIIEPRSFDEVGEEYYKLYKSLLK